TYAKPEEEKAGAPPAPPVEWKELVKAGILFTTGNSETTNGTFVLSVSRKESANRFAFDANAAYGRSNILVADVAPADPTMITGFHTTEVTTNNNWLSKARYDWFFTANNSGYASGLAGADKIAGKSFVGGGQAGYSRQLVKGDVHTLGSEIGSALSHERYVQQPMRTIDPVTIQSARLFIGETMKLSPASVA